MPPPPHVVMTPNFCELHLYLFVYCYRVLLCRYLNAIERNPDDPDAYYNWALVLQVNLQPLNHICTITFLTLTVTNAELDFCRLNHACKMDITRLISRLLGNHPFQTIILGECR